MKYRFRIIEKISDKKNSGKKDREKREIIIFPVFLTEIERDFPIEKLEKLCRDFCADCHDGFISNDKSYIELWLEKNIKDS